MKEGRTDNKEGRMFREEGGILREEVPQMCNEVRSFCAVGWRFSILALNLFITFLFIANECNQCNRGQKSQEPFSIRDHINYGYPPSHSHPRS
jgi:hypothetical protein